MGEAARRKVQIEALQARNSTWLDSLSPTERLVATVAQTAYDKIVVGLGMTEGCYHLSFFLHEYLHRKHGIDVQVVVGWVNDGEWDGATSHAWVEHQGKKIDISLNMTSHPDAQPPGDLIILDHIVKKGTVIYQYWAILPDKAQRTLERMAAEHPEMSDLIKHKAIEHQQMLEFSMAPNGAEEYLRQVPPSGSYASLARHVG